jgi:TetR/AcrR family transcriptional repressor of nem operon
MKNKTERKNEIIRTSINLMYLKGYNGTSVKEITDAAGIPKGSFYNYFKDKEQYAIDAINYYEQYLTLKASEVLTNKELKPLDRIKEFFKLSIKNLREKNLKYGCFVGNLTQEMGDVSQLISNAASKVDETKARLIKENLLEAYQNKELKKEIDSEILANFILNSWQGALVRMKMNSNKRPLDDFYSVLCNTLLR